MVDIETLYYIEMIIGIILYVNYKNINPYLWYLIFIIGVIIGAIIYSYQRKIGIRISFKKEQVKQNINIMIETGYFETIFKFFRPLVLIGGIYMIIIGWIDIKVHNNSAGYAPLIIGMFCLIFSIYLLSKKVKFEKYK
jgi:hypothetical protein